jgi:hypothetical protein
VAGSLGRYTGTHHLSTNHAIILDSDEATTRSYLLAAHVLTESDPARHADGAGWYRCRLRRTPDGWRFTTSHWKWSTSPESRSHTEPVAERVGRP